MKRIISTAWIVILLMLLCCCQKTASKIQLHQPEDQITRIVFMDHTGIHEGNAPIEILVAEEDKTVAELRNDLKEMDCYEFRNDPATSYGHLYIEVFYEDGAVDVIGTDMLEYRSANGKTEDVYDGWYYADMDSMLALYEQYTGRKPVIP